MCSLFDGDQFFLQLKGKQYFVFIINADAESKQIAKLYPKHLITTQNFKFQRFNYGLDRNDFWHSHESNSHIHMRAASTIIQVVNHKFSHPGGELPYLPLHLHPFTSSVWVFHDCISIITIHQDILMFTVLNYHAMNCPRCLTEQQNTPRHGNIIISFARTLCFWRIPPSVSNGKFKINLTLTEQWCVKICAINRCND